PEESGAKGKRNHRLHGWQCMPLRDISAHRGCDSESCEDDSRVRCRERSGAMNDQADVLVPLEPERYELAAAPPYRFDLDRREFFKFLGAGMLVVSILIPAAAAQESGGARQRRGESLPKEIDAWLHLGENGKVTLYTGKV